MAQMTKNDVWPMVKEAGVDWMDDKASKLAAALAYYTVISLAPLVIITIKIVGWVYRDHPEAAVEKQANDLTGGMAGETIGQIIKNAGEQGAGFFATIISIIIVLVSASAVFAELQDSLNTIWEVKPKPNRGIWGTIKDRFLSMAMVLAIAFLFIISLAVSTAIGAVSGGIMESTIGSDNIVTKVIVVTIDLVISTAVVTVLFAAIYKFLPDVNIAWRDVWVGALLTGILFQLGKYALTIYFNVSAPASAYGAAGSLIALLIWLYYSAQILFFGAEVTQVYARKFGSGINPTENAMPVTDAERANRGQAPGATTAKAPQQLPSPARPVALRPGMGSVKDPDMKRPLIFGGGGIAAGLLLGAAGAYAMKRSNKPGRRAVAAVDLDHRLDAVEERMLHIKGLYDTAYNLNRPKPVKVEVPVEKIVEVSKPVPVPQPPPTLSWSTALHNAVWKHPKLWPIAKAMQLYKLTTR
ncbi:MAG TPA: YihY/virulence factor BrkB family protein [Tepidisphaeraceae bacterium]|jgi:membrane protein|nr:YihY/virulence factor BrkB family protein [Tepidisphaeraceae bacterium]